MKKGEIILQPHTEAARRLKDRNRDVIKLQSRYNSQFLTVISITYICPCPSICSWRHLQLYVLLASVSPAKNRVRLLDLSKLLVPHLEDGPQAFLSRLRRPILPQQLLKPIIVHLT